MKLTPAAIEKIQDLWYSDNQPEGLRIAVSGGGCAGFQYIIEWSTKSEDDTILKADSVPVFIDSISLQYLSNATLDFQEFDFESKFSIQNPDVQSTCGCGSSFNPY